ncbi:alpha/beta hydrolase [Neolewinella lacunae]|uniref:Alpha/beta hydrolase n=1 Tax=Neolewinella lacunae TaxID=1517758 RepID=A0A923T7D1_9BACT|nr:alpha/beta hydrolase [Neolewinella lacunae]MBC6994375.1 alpha/beta hydrolase [Neolewinella lacunae]MDN3633306.1 alpha/beta hydrolase [Neolewinella lacunae]
MATTKEKLMLSGLRRLLNGTARMTRRGAGRIGYYLLTNPRRLNEDPANEVFLQSAQQSIVKLHDTDICTYHWPGPGPSVLLLHGWESSTARWFALFKPLQDAGFNIYAFDAPAHGRSGGKQFNVFFYCQVLDAYCQHLGFAPDYWVGHSGGGMAAIYYNCTPEFTYSPKQIVSMAVPGELENFIDKFCEIVGANERVKYGIEYRFQRKLDRRFADVSFIEYVKNIRVPGLILHDEEDDVAPFFGAQRMHANWKGSTLASTRGCGHSLVGELVPAIVVEYLRRCSEHPVVVSTDHLPS